jgi:flagellar biosynthesis protein FlhA
MSNRPSLALPMLVALGVGALVGASAAATQKDKLPAIGGPRPTLEGAQPLPDVEIAMGPALAAAGGRLRDTVAQVPQAIREALGFAPATIQFREDIDLAANGYTLRLRGLAVGAGLIHPDRQLALGTVDGSRGDLPGEPAVEPVSGRHGVWIADADAGQAVLLGYDVLEPGFAMALHVDTLLRRNLHELLTREEAYRLLDRARQTAPKTVDELVGRLEVGLVQRVLKNLLREQVGMRDLPAVLESLADGARQTQDPAALTEIVRGTLSRQITAALVGDTGALAVIPLGPRWEQLRHAKAGEPVVREMVGELRRQLNAARDLGHGPVLLAPADLRAHVRRLFERDLPDLPVLSEQEIDPAVRVEPVPGLLVS